MEPIKIDGQLVVALIALVQPWVISFYKKNFRQPEIKINPTGSIEIGFSGLGHTVSITGVLRTLKKDVFISSINMETVKIENDAKLKFQWIAQRSNKLFHTNPREELFAADSFTLTSGSTRHYNNTFASKGFKRKFQDHTINTQEEWRNFILQKNNPQGDSNFYENELLEFIKVSQHFNNYHTALNNDFYWTPGKYKIKLEINTEETKTPFAFIWDIEITEDSSRKLRNNTINILRECCSLSTNYYFDYQEYSSTQTLIQPNKLKNIFKKS
ncbi:hypothetical protein HA052_22645 [Chromobacterium haemolyticum]|uniref:Uncharacterized protein n=1 Tax=Chromobacterium fluminis TaxID=3044269 RepID=A0ABX0LEQ3_9NEIS|nr:hypothetical protein [Chromobacterium haemolyticum]NHR07992.1 hypothetical protein [Chromobacterium haemolyticum]